MDFERKTIRIEENCADEMSSQTILPPPPPPKKNPTDVQIAPPRIPKGPVTELSYDKLVVAVGAYSQTFGIEGVRQHANFLRDIGDARKIRLRVLAIFEQCTSTTMCKSIPTSYSAALLENTAKKINATFCSR